MASIDPYPTPPSEMIFKEKQNI